MNLLISALITFLIVILVLYLVTHGLVWALGRLGEPS